ncbi:hypothetical protein [Clostridium botulinum]|uniref:hypothetical protein n=1 Tax=Clostridium botulinum TaxID=1491 RepID=UPI0013F05F72|nr:hypothetical protein [Clostridium botulinum]EGT5649375.1 hypothetical protein [Clostridium botulinum]MBY6755495.1 hypothetical protein [Clostridium botulinum]MBY6766422.1 hypothetical protein [Clostridium botulinum]MBY6900374.1 hypothetical protein [Clostridium botulinum]MBY6914627.1 hypothetical protein [Clostridium botulinum]
MNYRNLKGLESEDKWGNRTKIIDVDTDVIVIATYRNHCHDTCITRQIWRDDYYGEPTLHGGYNRMKEELKICGFDLDIKTFKYIDLDNKILQIHVVDDEKGLLISGTDIYTCKTYLLFSDVK